MQSPLESASAPGKSAWDKVRRFARNVALIAIATAVLLSGRVVAQPEVAAGPADAYIGRGIQLMRDGEFAAAKVQFAAAVKADQKSASALTWRGICENQLKQYREASQDFEAALRIDPTALPAHYNLALSLIRLGQTDAAIRELETVVEANPDAVDAQYNLAILLEGKRSIAQAAEHLNAAYQVQPNDLGIAQHLLIDDLSLGKSAAAEPILQSLQSESTPAKAQMQIGTALLAAAHFSQAAALIESARLRLPPSKESEVLLAQAYIGAQEDFKAIDLLKNSGQDATGTTAYLLGLAYVGAGATQEAIAAFQAAAKANPRDPKPLFHLGMIYSAMPEQQTEALHDLREAVRLDPQNASFAIALARSLLAGDQPKQALEVLEHVHAQGVAAAERDLLFGIAQVTTSGVAVATPTLQHAVELDPSIALSHNLLGFCYFRQGDYAHAAQSYQRASDLQPDALIFAYDAALAFARANQGEEALVYAKRAVSLPSARSEDHYLLGKLYAQADRKEDAVRELKLAVEMNPDLDNSYYLLARSYMQMGDTAQAAEWNSRLTALKQKHDQSYIAQKNAQAGEVPSSTLLRGAPMTSEENGVPGR
jgi:tetratricopeptide (TPR) repeat protein